MCKSQNILHKVELHCHALYALNSRGSIVAVGDASKLYNCILVLTMHNRNRYKCSVVETLLSYCIPSKLQSLNRFSYAYMVGNNVNKQKEIFTHK